jgi:hypothetical protein
VAHIRGAKGWTVEVVQNGLTEAMHTPRYIRVNEYCATFPRIVHTAGTFRVKCTSGDGQSVLSEPVRAQLDSGEYLLPSDDDFGVPCKEIPQRTGRLETADSKKGEGF